MTLRYALLALILLTRPASVAGYSDLDDYLRQTSGFDARSEQARCYAEAVQSSMQGMLAMIKSVFSGNYNIPPSTRGSMDRMMQENWRQRGARTRADLVRLACPSVEADDATPIEEILPLEKLPTR